MRIVFEIVIGWVILSCTLGPALLWLFFYGKRRERTEREAEQPAWTHYLATRITTGI